MKFDEMRSIGHNVAASLASGVCLLIGMYDVDVFDEARRSREGFIEVDFLNGVSSGGHPSPSLAHAINLYGKALPSLCDKHGTSSTAFRCLNARYFASGLSTAFLVTIVNREGRCAVDEYIGLPGRRIRVCDQLGRIRPKRGVVFRVDEGDSAV